MKSQRAAKKAGTNPSKESPRKAAAGPKITANKRARKVSDELDDSPEQEHVPAADVKQKKTVSKKAPKETKKPNKVAKGEEKDDDTPVSTSEESTKEAKPRKRAKIEENGNEKLVTDKEKSTDNSEPKKQAKVKKQKDDKNTAKDTAKTLPLSSAAPSGNRSICRMASWNVNGVRAWLTKGGLEFFKNGDFDVFLMQETKCSESKIPAELTKYDGYSSYFSSGSDDFPGYAGVGVLTRLPVKNVSFGIDFPEFDREGRVITLEFSQFYLINVYVPNSSRGLTRLDYRMKWDKCFRAYLCRLKKEKPVIVGGDFNVAHNEIDLKNPKTNERNAGFTKEERESFTDLLKEGFVDSYRTLHPDEIGYTFWSYMRSARAKNIGWRLDYFLVSEEYFSAVSKSSILDKIMGSDHCPIILESS